MADESERETRIQIQNEPSTTPRKPSKASTKLSSLFKPEKKIGKAPSYKDSFIAIAKASWLNVLLVFIPISWALHFVDGISDTVVFVMSFLAIIPLAKLLGFATEEIALRVGQALGGLINATLGNAVELIVAIIALVKCELEIVQSSLLGSILSNLLLVLGCCFLAAGLRFSEVGFGRMGVQTNYSLLIMSVIAILIPAGFHAAFDSALDDEAEAADILKMSRGIAVMLLIIYVAYLVFTLWSHAHFFDETTERTTKELKRGKSVYGKHRVFKEAKSARISTIDTAIKKKPHHQNGGPTEKSTGVSSSLANPEKQLTNEPEQIENTASRTTDTAETSSVDSRRRITTSNLDAEEANISNTTQNDSHSHSSATRNNLDSYDNNNEEEDEDEDDEEEEEEEPTINVGSAIICLIVVTVFVGVTAEWLVDSINGLTETGAISTEWVGLILLPIVGNAAEHVTAVLVATKDKLDLSLSVAVGSSIQIALFVIPLLVIIAWGLDKPLSLLFNPFESIVLFLSVMIVQATLQDNRANWLEGFILAFVYIIIALAFWWYPQDSPESRLFSC